MQKSVTVDAPAKINLGLHVFPKRDDGYHNLMSIFTTVDLCDSITLSLIQEKNICRVSVTNMTLPEENTFTIAYKAFCVLTGVEQGVDVNVTKRIPSGGGLGGGSSDASSFIQSMDLLCGTHLSKEDLTSIAGKVGSDVYFFTHALLEKSSEEKHYAAFVSGRGEVVEKIKSRSDYSLVLVFPEVFVSTKEAYKLVDLHMDKCKSVSPEQLKLMYTEPLVKWNFYNSFTRPVCSVYEKIDEALTALKKEGAVFADMSGSGSTVYGVFETEKDALKAQRNLASVYKTVLA